jgi:hypothetical protein
MHTYHRSSHNNNTTSCFIQLENWNKHALLTELLNQLEFHGTQLRAEESTFNFQFDDNEYEYQEVLAVRYVSMQSQIKMIKYHHNQVDILTVNKIAIPHHHHMIYIHHLIAHRNVKSAQMQSTMN